MSVAIAVVGLVAVGSPAAAHGGGGADSTNFLTSVSEPGAPGLEWTVYGGDALIELNNRTGVDVVVIGYQQEPYLRFERSGDVFENERSPTAALNQDRYGNTDVPADADADAAPRWRKVSGNGRYAWHDHRAHWMSPTPPPIVSDNPDVEHVILDWTIPVDVGESPAADRVEASGDLRWIPGVSPWPPLLLTATAFLAVIGLAAVLTRPRDGRWPGVVRTATVIVWGVCVANIARTVDDIVALPAPGVQRFMVVLTASGAFTVIGALTFVAWRRRPGAFLAVGGAGVLLMLLFGSSATAQLSDSQIATVWPIWVRRWTVAASWTAVVPTFIAALLGSIHYSRHLNNAPPGDVLGDDVTTDPARST